MGRQGLVLALVIAGGLGGCASSDGVPIAVGRFDENPTLKTLSGVGLVGSKKESIDYRPRSPLVLPQKFELRDPETATAEVSNPAWPKDADASRRRMAQDMEARALEEDRRGRGSTEGKSVLLSAEEMKQGRRDDLPGSAPGISRSDRDGTTLLPSEYQQKKSPERVEEERLAALTPEPPRKYLTEPPTGYRAPVAATSPEGQKAAEEALKARQNAKPEKRGVLGWLGL